MKKALTIILLVIAFIIIYFLQLNFFTWFTIAGVKPNLFVILVLFIGLYSGSKMGTVFGLIFGFIIELISGSVIGGLTISLGAIGFLSGYLEKNLSKDSKMTVMLLVMIATAMTEIFSYVFRILIFSGNVEFLPFLKTLLIEILYNMILTIILYPFMQKMGYKVEDIYKNPQILTRYF